MGAGSVGSQLLRGLWGYRTPHPPTLCPGRATQSPGAPGTACRNTHPQHKRGCVSGESGDKKPNIFHYHFSFLRFVTDTSPWALGL